MFRQFKLRAQKDGFRVAMLIELNQTINHWVQEHILRVDTQLRPCLTPAAA